jgi:hypothetical protein
MRAYLIDEIPPLDIERIRRFLKKNARPSLLQMVYWIPFPREFLTPVQQSHLNCQPFVAAAEVGTGWVKVEFYSRSLVNLRCSCHRLCNEPQRNFLIDFADRMLRELDGRHRKHRSLFEQSLSYLFDDPI